MKQLLRLLKVLWFSKWLGPLDLFDEGEVRLRVWPNDLDPLMHMNNGAYLTLLDLGRISWMVRGGWWTLFNKNNIYAVVGSEAIKFRRSLTLFARFTIKTKLIYWDDKFFFIQQHFIYKKEVAAAAIIKIRFLRKSGERVPPADILKLKGLLGTAPPRSDLVQNFLAMEEDLR